MASTEQVGGITTTSDGSPGDKIVIRECLALAIGLLSAGLVFVVIRG